MTKVDLVALGFVALTAFIGWKKGLLASALSVAGIVLGAWLGSRIAPALLQGGTSSPYTPLAALAGAAVGAILLETLGTLAGTALRSRIRKPRFSSFDSFGGLALGGLAGLTIVWVLGAVALLLPGQADLRHGAQQSALLRRLNEVVSPEKVLNALARIDPFPAISGPAAPVTPPDPRLAHALGVRRAGPSVVRVLGTACGVGVEGSGWTARVNLVVTAAHVVAGQSDTVVELQSGARLPAEVVAFDARNDIAVLRVDGLGLRPLPLVRAQSGTAVAVLGFPENGPFTATPARIGRTSVVLAEDAYGRGPVTRAITSLGGRVRHGDSGAPAVDANGAVQSTVFASRLRSVGGYGVPDTIVRAELNRSRGPVSTGDCAP
ncbi:MAG TPA: MarP family serine protease [Gaiellaceae bacterium]|jgi:S1-C subfamily serine protease|nr:MarP family serine protease [Gaiellaceae bacterium]HWJ45210.1 MarP family serine protease [Gaiellaceae bacterium]